METQLKNKLNLFFQSMDIPEMRKELNLTNLRWLQRNISIRNSKHPDYDESNILIGELIKIMPMQFNGENKNFLNSRYWFDPSHGYKKHY